LPLAWSCRNRASPPALVRGSTSTDRHAWAAATSLPPAAAVCPRELRGSGCSGSGMRGNLASIGGGHPPPSVGGCHLAGLLLAGGRPGGRGVQCVLWCSIWDCQRGTSETTRRSTPNWDRYFLSVAQLKAQEFACVGHGPSIFCFKPGHAASDHRFSPYIIADR
jgi:hypothetical protein